MNRKYPRFVRIDHDRDITEDTDAQFLHHLRTGLLLALRERGRINASQYRQAEEKLNSSRRNRALERDPE